MHLFQPLYFRLSYCLECAGLTYLNAFLWDVQVAGRQLEDEVISPPMVQRCRAQLPACACSGD